MKIRIKGNSVRFRLTKSEVEKLKTDGFYEERTDFGSNTFTYRLEARDIEHLTATFEDQCIQINMPKSHANEWYDIDRVGYQHDLVVGENKMLSLLIEKDFVCLDETTEDQSDNYPHPLESTIS